MYPYNSLLLLVKPLKHGRPSLRQAQEQLESGLARLRIVLHHLAPRALETRRATRRA
jgi:hypothetical protein